MAHNIEIIQQIDSFARASEPASQIGQKVYCCSLSGKSRVPRVPLCVSDKKPLSTAPAVCLCVYKCVCYNIG